MKIAYSSKDPIKTLFGNIKAPTFEYMKEHLLSRLRLPEYADNEDHPHHATVEYVKRFCEEKDPPNVRVMTMFTYIVTSMVTFYGNEFVFPYVHPNVPQEYLWFDVTGEMTKIHLVGNSFADTSKPVRVKFNKESIFSFNLDDGMKLNTPRSHDCFHIDKMTLTQANPSYDCVVVITLYRDLPRVFYNDQKKNVVWECPFFNFQ